MFDFQQVNAYRNIEAPQGLRQQVLTAAKRHKPSRRGQFAGAAALAACLALVLGLSLTGLGRADVLLMGEPLKEGTAVVVETAGQTPVVTFSRQAADTEQLELELELRLKDSTRLEFSGGTGTVLQDGEVQNDLTGLKGTVHVLWQIDPTRVDQTYQLTMYGEDTCRTITLSYEESKGDWIAQINH